MDEHIYKQMTLISNEYRKGKRATKLFNGHYFTKQNHDGSIDQFVETEMDVSSIHNNRIPFCEGNQILFEDKILFIDSLFKLLGKKTLLMRVS